MRHQRTWIAAALAAALLAACGGSDPDVPGSGSPSGAPTTKGSFEAVVSFGDSLSDVGAYTPATLVPGTGTDPVNNPPVYFGGKFTTNNGSSSTVWVENVATALGRVVTPHEVGFAGQSVKCPAAANPALASTCTGYGQGGARVTDPNGIGKTGGALTVPVKTQIANHLARFGSFKASDLIFVFAGNNDAFIQFSTFTATAQQIQADAAAGRITADQANQLLFRAQTVAQEAMKQAALELAGYVKAEILAKGGRYVAVVNLPDSTLTPFGGTLPASVKPVLTGLVDVFNLWLRDGLTNQPVQILDANAALRDISANPSKYGITNGTVPACDDAKISALTGVPLANVNSLLCNATPGFPLNGLRAGADVNTWQFADGVHPTTGGHKLISDFVLQALRASGWI